MNVISTGLAFILFIAASGAGMWNCASRDDVRSEQLATDSLRTCDSATFDFPDPPQGSWSIAIDTLEFSVFNSCDDSLFITVDVEQWIVSNWRLVSDDIFSPPMFRLRVLTVAPGNHHTCRYPLFELHHESLVRRDTTRDVTVRIRFLVKYSFRNWSFGNTSYSPAYAIVWPMGVREKLDQWHEVERMQLGK